MLPPLQLKPYYFKNTSKPFIFSSDILSVMVFIRVPLLCQNSKVLMRVKDYVFTFIQQYSIFFFIYGFICEPRGI